MREGIASPVQSGAQDEVRALSRTHDDAQCPGRLEADDLEFTKSAHDRRDDDASGIVGDMDGLASDQLRVGLRSVECDVARSCRIDVAKVQLDGPTLDA